MRKDVGKPITSSEVFITLFREAATRDKYYVDGLKIEITEQIYWLMEKKHINQSDLARMLGTNRAYISRIMKGKTNFTIETLVKIGRRLGAEWVFQLVDRKTVKYGKSSVVAT